MKKILLLILLLIFMSLPVWGALQKSQSDNETIEEAITRLIQAHDDDANAHLDTGQSLQSHKASAIIDHLAASVVEDKIKSGEISNIKIKDNARAFTFIVDIGGDGDYNNLQDAINACNALGGGRIFVMAGTYNIISNITMYSNVELIGAGSGLVTLNFSNTSYYISIIGSTGTHKQGIKISGFKLLGNVSTVNAFIKLTYCDNVSIFDNYFYNSNSAGDGCFLLSNCTNINIKSNNVYGTDYLVKGSSSKILISENYLIYTYNGIYYGNGYALTESLITGNKIVEAGNYDLYFGSSCKNNIFSNNSVLDNQGNGIYITGDYNTICNNFIENNFNNYHSVVIDSTANYCNITDNLIRDGDGDGIRLNSNINRCVVSGNVVYNCVVYGININSSDCDKNIVTGNVCYSNDTGQINDSGTGTVKANNIES